MPALAPAVKSRISHVDIASAKETRGGGDRPGIQGRQRDRHLERRARCVHSVRRLVDQGRAGIGRPFLPLRLADARVEQGRIEGRIVRHGQDLAVAAIQHHSARAFVAEPVQHRLLQPDINGERDVVARRALLPGQFADDPAIGIDLKLDCAGAPAEFRFPEFLHPRAADPYAGQRQHRIIRDVVLGWRCDVADDVRHAIGERIHPRRAVIDDNARQIGRIHLDLRHLLPGQEFAHHHRNEAAVALHVALDPHALPVVQRHQRGKRIQRAGDIGCLLRNQQSTPVLAVTGQQHTEPVQDAPAWRGDHADAHAIVVRQRGVFRSLGDLHLIEPRAEHAQRGKLAPHHQQCAPGKKVGSLHLPPHQACSTAAMPRLARPSGIASAG